MRTKKYLQKYISVILGAFLALTMMPYAPLAAEPPATSITVNRGAATIPRDSSRTITAAVSPGDALQSVTWSLSGETDSSIDPATGILTVGGTETLENVLTITATATDGSGKTGTATVTVAMIPSVTSITIDRGADTITQDSTRSLTATVAPPDAAQAVTWSLSGETDSSIDPATGLLTIGSNETLANVLTITATATDGSGKTGTATVTVIPKVEAITVDRGIATLPQASTRAMVAAVSPADATQEVSWSLNGTPLSSIDPTTGLLTVDSNEPPDTVLTITATATDDSGITGTATVTITDTRFQQGSSYVQGSGQNLVFIVEDMDADQCTDVRIDNTALTATQHKVTQGSTVVTVYSAYLDTLRAGRHTLTVHYQDGTVVNGEFIIMAAGGEGPQAPISGISSAILPPAKTTALFLILTILISVVQPNRPAL